MLHAMIWFKEYPSRFSQDKTQHVLVF